MQITIDGPAGSGKSTIAKLLAEKLGITYLDTGAMYRAVTEYVLENNIDLNSDLDKLADQMENIDIRFDNTKVYLNECDVTEAIRNHEVTQNVSQVSAIDFVREEMTKKQREIAETKSVVMDGRDTGSTVLPDADYKFYLDASSECRAQRRGKEIGIKPGTPEFESLREEIVLRDYKDSTRKISPLVVPDGAIFINTDNLGIEEVLNELLKRIK